LAQPYISKDITNVSGEGYAFFEKVIRFLDNPTTKTTFTEQLLPDEKIKINNEFTKIEGDSV
jgi:hypothetical protein